MLTRRSEVAGNARRRVCRQARSIILRREERPGCKLSWPRCAWRAKSPNGSRSSNRFSVPLKLSSRRKVRLKSVSFGATVTLRDPHDKTETHTIVGVDELDFEPDALSWISPLGKALLASQLGDRITLEDGRTVKIVKIE
jgi:hypothetical protein